MTLLNHRYENIDALKLFLQKHAVAEERFVLVQLFSSNQSTETMYRVRDEVTGLLPNCSLIATSTAGIIGEGSILDETIILSFSVFHQSSVHAIGYTDQNIDSILNDLEINAINEDTKLLVVFANTFRFDSTRFLEALTRRFPRCSIAGGNAGDDYRFERCEVFSHDNNDCDVVVASISSKILAVKTEYLLNWQSIGQEMVVTKSNGTEVFEINGKSVFDIYKRYLGDEIAKNILKYGIEFPLIFKIGDIDVARAPIAFNPSSGSLTFAGEIPEGTHVRFGYADVEYIEDRNQDFLSQRFHHRQEGIYIYSCSARRQMLGTYLNHELADMNQIGTTSGFITYGEFFHDGLQCKNMLLNITTTFVTLNETPCSLPLKLHRSTFEKDKKDIILKALTTLITQTSEDLDSNIDYLQQFRNAVNEASIFSTSDEKGVITDVNKNFEMISGYTRSELIGKHHNLIRSEDMPNEIFAHMWKSIKEGKIWKGLIQNKRKNGSFYYVITQISPIFNRDGSLKEFIAIRNDVTELEEYKQFLKAELDVTSNNYQETLHYAEQYEKAINATTAIVKTDINNIITYANDTFCILSGYTHAELIGANFEKMRSRQYLNKEVCKKIHDRLSAKEEVYETLTNIAKDGSDYVVYCLFYPILDRNGKVIEHLLVMHDITQVIQLSEEIVNTQKEVVMTMGAIGETRSKETGLHVKRVAEYSYLLAKLSGLDEEEANLLKQASPMHDIGKVGIPDHILNKPGKLTPEEFDIMMTHASLGYDMLKSSERAILKASAVVAYTHHEKWDGSGYPRGLKGEEIPLFGRITAIADVFDALGHDRVYKKAWETERIFALFKEERGKHFDPVLIDLFFEHLDQFLAIQNRYNDHS